MLPILLAAAAAGISLLRRKTRKNPVRRLSGHRRVKRKNPVVSRSDYTHNIFWRDIPKTAKVYELEGAYVVHMPDGRKGTAYWTGNDAGKAQAMLDIRALPESALRKNPSDAYVLKNRIAHLRGLIREAPAEDKVKLREILKSEQLKLMKPRKNPLYPVVMPRPDEVSDMSVREMREFLAEHNINGDSFGNKRLRKEVRRVIHKSVRKNPRNKRKMSVAESRTVFDGYNAARQRDAEATLRTPAGEAARHAWNAAMLKRLRSNPKKRRSTRKAKR